MKVLTQAAVFAVLSNDALPAIPKRKSPWQQSSPTISEDQLDFKIFAVDPVRPEFNPTNCASSIPLPPCSLPPYIPRGRAGHVRRYQALSFQDVASELLPESLIATRPTHLAHQPERSSSGQGPGEVAGDEDSELNPASFPTIDMTAPSPSTC